MIHICLYGLSESIKNESKSITFLRYISSYENRADGLRILLLEQQVFLESEIKAHSSESNNFQ